MGAPAGRKLLIEPAGQSRFNGLIPMSARKFAADKLLWETLGRWKRSSPELDRIQFLKTVPFFDRLSNRQLKTVSDIMFERNYDTEIGRASCRERVKSAVMAGSL